MSYALLRQFVGAPHCRGGEKISPLEIDGVLLSHPAVAEAVCFGAPDEKYGEVVAAAVVLRQGAGADGVAEDIKRHCASRLAPFKVGLVICQDSHYILDVCNIIWPCPYMVFWLLFDGVPSLHPRYREAAY